MSNKIGKATPTIANDRKGNYNRLVKKEARRASRRAWKMNGQDAAIRFTRGYGD
jgi:hypothetical protein